jgi:redox-sensitive bicupin YhaK (pirin superfamily)
MNEYSPNQPVRRQPPELPDSMLGWEKLAAHAGQGFGTHPHRAREIFLYVLEGALEHKDSMGSGSIIRPGDVQLMRAGTGVAHSEYNDSSTPVHFLQIWINPALRNTMPLYRQQHFAAEERRGRLRLILSPDAAQGSLSIQQDARVYTGLFDGRESAQLRLAPDRFACVMWLAAM